MKTILIYILLIFGLSCYSQGRASLLGVSAVISYEFSPITMGNLQMWYKADAGITLNGSTVSNWADQSGNNRDMIQGTATNQPTFTTNAINGTLPALTFDGVNDYMALSADYSVSNAMTYFVVFRMESQKENSILSGSSGNYAYLQFGSTWYVGSTATSVAMSSATWYLRSATADATNNIAERFSNSTSQGTTATSIGYKLQRYLGQYNFEAARYLYGSIAEILIYNKKLNSTELGDVNDYLNNKYNIY